MEIQCFSVVSGAHDTNAHLFEGGKAAVYHPNYAIQVVNGVACVCMVCSCSVGAYGCANGLVHGASCFDWTTYALC